MTYYLFLLQNAYPLTPLACHEHLLASYCKQFMPSCSNVTIETFGVTVGVPHLPCATLCNRTDFEVSFLFFHLTLSFCSFFSYFFLFFLLVFLMRLGLWRMVYWHRSFRCISAQLHKYSFLPSAHPPLPSLALPISFNTIRLCPSKRYNNRHSGLCYGQRYV